MAEHEVESTEQAPSVETGPVAEADPVVDGGAGDAGPVGAALAELDTLDERDLAEHPEVFERIHGQLHAALSAIDDA